MPHDLDNIDVPPAAPSEPREHELHGRRWTDDYGWMRDHSDPRFLAYLRAERGYYDAAASRLEGLQTEVFHEVERRLLPTDSSVSWRHGSRFYYTRTVAGSEYEQFLQAGHDGDSDRAHQRGGDRRERSAQRRGRAVREHADPRVDVSSSTRR